MKHLKNKFLIYSLFTLGLFAQEEKFGPHRFALKRVPVPPPITQDYF